MEKNSKIYLAGHTGLVGSALWKTLEEKAYNNLIGKTFEELDLRDQKAVAEFFRQEKPEYVILAAAKVGGIVANNTYRGEFIYENLMIQNNIIHQSFLFGVKKLLFLGSTCIYPREAPQPMQEDYLLTSPLEYTNEPYAIAKIAGIKLCESYNIQYGTNFVSVMPTNLYGPNDNFDLEKSHVLPALMRKIHLGKLLENVNFDGIVRDLSKRPVGRYLPSQGQGFQFSEPRKEEVVEILRNQGIKESPNNQITVEIWGSGKPMREFLWSEEMAEACVFVMENVDFKYISRVPSPAHPDTIGDSRIPEIRNTHINIGTGKEISIKDLAFLIKDTIGFNGELVFNNSRPDGTMRKLTDVRKLHSLGWKHEIEIEIGVRKLYNWYIESISIN
jgi:GDP-L-fucose synthase